MFKSTVTSAALVALAFAGTATAQERTILTEAPTADEYVDMLFSAQQVHTIKTRGLPVAGVKTRGIQMTGSQSSSAVTQAPRPVAAPKAAATPQTAPQPHRVTTPQPAVQAASNASATLTQINAPASQPLTQPTPRPASVQPAVSTVQSPPSQPAGPATTAPVKKDAKIVAAPVNFEHDSANIPTYFEPYLINLAAAMQRPEAKGKLLIVSGHTDSRGTDAYNLELSMRRAQAIEVFLLARGVPSSQLVSTGKGERELIAGRETDHAVNRRVEFKVAG